MWQLNFLKINKFLAIENSEISFENYPQLTFIEGINNDLGRSNGAGKTTLLNSIVFAIFGRTVMNLQVDIFEGSDVELKLFHNYNFNFLYIRRIRNSSGNKLIVKLDDKEIESNTITQQQSKLYSILGFNDKLKDSEILSDFTTSTFIANSTLDTLASGKYSPKDRMDLICRMLNLEFWDKGIINARTDVTNLKSNLLLIDNELNFLINIVSEENEETLKNELVTLYKEKYNLILDIKYLKEEIEKAEKIINIYNTYNTELRNKGFLIVDKRQAFRREIDRYKDECSKINDYIKEAEDWIGNFSDLDYTSIQEDYKENEVLIQQIENENNELFKEKIHLESYLDTLLGSLRYNSDKSKNTLLCPICNSSLMLDQDKLESYDVDIIKNIIEKYKQEIKQKEIKLTIIENNKKELSQTKSNYIKKRDNFMSDLEIINRVEASKQNIIDKLKFVKEREILIEEISNSYQSEINSLEKEKEELKSKLTKLNVLPIYSDKLEEYKNNVVKYETKLNSVIIPREIEIEEKLKNLDKLANKIKEKKKEIKIIEDSLELSQFWVKGFNRIKGSIVDDFVPFLSQRTNELIEITGMDFSVELLTMRELKSNELKQEFNIEVVDKFGRKRQIDSFSDGERKTLAICLSLAVNQYRSDNKSMPFGFILSDEIFDGLDIVGQSAIIKVLSNIDKQILLISHSEDLKNLFTNKLIAVKNKGVVKIERNL